MHRYFASSSVVTDIQTSDAVETSNLTLHRSPMAPYPQSDTKFVPPHINRPPYADSGYVAPSRYGDDILIHHETSVKRMRNAAQLARRTLDLACSLAQPGITTDEIDDEVHAHIIANNAYPSPLNYAGFPKSLCSSVNEVICHGIPDSRPLQFGDIVSFDVSCFLNGVHGDNCATVIVGDSQETDFGAGADWRGVPFRTEFDNASDEKHFIVARELIQASRESLYAAIAVCKPGGCLSDVGGAIQDVADRYGFSSCLLYTSPSPRD